MAMFSEVDLELGTSLQVIQARVSSRLFEYCSTVCGLFLKIPAVSLGALPRWLGSCFCESSALPRGRHFTRKVQRTRSSGICDLSDTSKVSSEKIGRGCRL